MSKKYCKVLLNYLFRIFFEVKTDTVVVQVAQKLTVVQVLVAFLFDHMVYQTSFSKEVVVWEQHFAISLGKIHNSNASDDNNNDNNVFSQLINTRSITIIFVINIKHVSYHTKVAKKQTFKYFGESLGEKKPNPTMN